MAGGNPALRDPPRRERIDGKIYNMARPSLIHSKVSFNLTKIIDGYLSGKACEVYQEATVVLDGKNELIPDVSVVCDRNKLTPNKIIGSPDLVVEILSPGTATKDLTKKLEQYQAHGVREYWIVDPVSKMLYLYALADGKLELQNTYHPYLDWELEGLETDEEKAAAADEFSPVIFPDLVIKIADVFQD